MPASRTTLSGAWKLARGPLRTTRGVRRHAARRARRGRASGQPAGSARLRRPLAGYPRAHPAERGRVALHAHRRDTRAGGPALPRLRRHRLLLRRLGQRALRRPSRGRVLAVGARRQRAARSARRAQRAAARRLLPLAGRRAPLLPQPLDGLQRDPQKQRVHEGQPAPLLGRAAALGERRLPLRAVAGGPSRDTLRARAAPARRVNTRARSGGRRARAPLRVVGGGTPGRRRASRSRSLPKRRAPARATARRSLRAFPPEAPRPPLRSRSPSPRSGGPGTPVSRTSTAPSSAAAGPKPRPSSASACSNATPRHSPTH